MKIVKMFKTALQQALSMFVVRRSISKVKLNEIFECDGELYAIAKPDTASGNSNLQYGRSMFEFIRL